MRILICGDIMPGGVLPYQEKFIDDNLKDYITGFDFRIGTLECAIGTNLSPASEKLKENGGNNNICYARDEDFYRLKELGFDAVSLGNNHSFDLGKDGLNNAIRHLRENGIAYFGAGMNLSEASAPAIIKKQGLSICLIGCCIKGIAPKSLIAATTNHYGVYHPTIEELALQVKSLHGKYDKIIVLPHWGEEHILIPPYKCVEYAQRLVDAGADAVFGCHSHRISTIITYKNKPIYFGLGNFLYPDYCLKPPRPFYYPESVEELKLMPRCINYPKSVSCNTMVVWSEHSRIGIASEVIMDRNKIHVKRTFVRLGMDNVLRFLKDDSNFKTFFGVGTLLSLANLLTYPLIYKLTHRLTWRLFAHFGMKNLGDFRKAI